MNNTSGDWFIQTSDLLADLPTDIYPTTYEYDAGNFEYQNTSEIKDLNEYPLSDLEELLSSPNIRLGPPPTHLKTEGDNDDNGTLELTRDNQQLSQTIINGTIPPKIPDSTTSTSRPELADAENLVWDGLVADPMPSLTQSKESILSMNAKMLERQRELNRALKKQEELNQRLEQQLKQAQLHQRALERKIRDQIQLTREGQQRQSTARAMLGDITASSRLNTAAINALTPVKPVKPSVQRIYGEELWDENSAKKFQRLEFSVQPNLVSRGATADGSPQRRVGFKSRINAQNDRSPHKYRVRQTDSIGSLELVYPEGDRNASDTENDTGAGAQPSTGAGTVPTTAISSPLFSPSNMTLGIENTVSPVVTSGSNKAVRRSSLLPFGSAGYNKKGGNDSSSGNHGQTHIQSNSHNYHRHYHSVSFSSPINQTCFLATRTPVKRLTSNQFGKNYNLLDPLSMATPKLAPPQRVEGPISVTTDSPPIKKEPEPESQFTVSKTPSPILKSQGHFQGHSPQFSQLAKQIETNNVNLLESPLKITRKLTTLPRGSIDIYVKELPDKMFECLYPGCSKTFKRRYNIRSHIQTHLEDRPYACDFEGCDKAFVRNHDLARHKKSHFEKMYACPCGKKFNREDALVVHRSRMICVGGKKYENVVIRRSPRKRGRPRKNEVVAGEESPTKKIDTGDGKEKEKREATIGVYPDVAAPK